MTVLQPNEFRCSACGGVFEKARSDEEAMAESAETFGETPEEELAVVCDSCFKKITGTG